MALSELTKIEAQIGFTVGVLIGVFASWAFILFFTTWQWYFKVFSSIGELGIVGTLVLQLAQTIKTRKDYIEVMKNVQSAQMDEIKEQNEKGG